MRKYQPSNGSEGDYFISEHCMQCLHCDPDPNGEKQCKILLYTMCFNVHDKEYPEEWCYIDGKPTCTKWQKWDWSNDGDPDNPKAPPVYDPNQLLLFSVADNISVCDHHWHNTGITIQRIPMKQCAKCGKTEF